MAKSKTKAAPARARIAHKLAKYVRANLVHLSGKLGDAIPSISHLSNFPYNARSWWISKKKNQKCQQNLVPC